MRRVWRSKGRRQRQALGLNASLLERCLSACDTDTLKGLCDAALQTTHYDSLCRRSEIAALRVEDLIPTDDGGLIALVRRSKTDLEGEGRYAYISAETAALLARWRTAAGIHDGPLFRNVRNAEASHTAISRASIGWLLKRIARAAGLPDEVVAGHVGAFREGGSRRISPCRAPVIPRSCGRAGGRRSTSSPAKSRRRSCSAFASRFGR